MNVLERGALAVLKLGLASSVSRSLLALYVLSLHIAVIICIVERTRGMAAIDR
jgi:hypothetical protein